MTNAPQPNLIIEPLASRHDKAHFSCGTLALDTYLHQQAGQDARKHTAATFVLLTSDASTVLGFYSLSATSVPLADFPEDKARKLPKYPHVPAILLGRLAVDQSQKGKGFGELLLIDSLQRCLRTKDIGWAAVVVDAKDDHAVSFYEHYHFIRFSPSANRLFLARETIAKLLK